MLAGGGETERLRRRFDFRDAGDKYRGGGEDKRGGNGIKRTETN